MLVLAASYCSITRPSTSIRCATSSAGAHTSPPMNRETWRGWRCGIGRWTAAWLGDEGKGVSARERSQTAAAAGDIETRPERDLAEGFAWVRDERSACRSERDRVHARALPCHARAPAQTPTAACLYPHPPDAHHPAPTTKAHHRSHTRPPDAPTGRIGDDERIHTEASRRTRPRRPRTRRNVPVDTTSCR
jgi:hypothetical protein